MAETSPESLTPPEPFVIRAHHTELLQNVLGGTSPSLHVEQVRRVSREHRYDPWLPHGYYADVYGLDREAGESAAQGEEQFYKDFLELPKDHPVKLVANQKDGICAACVVGDHCSLKEGKFGETLSGDTSYIRAFELAARRLGREAEVTKVWDVAEFSNGKPRRVPGLLTNADCLKQVMSSYEYLRARDRSPFTKLAGHLADEMTPENFQRTHPKLRHKISALRPIVAVGLLLLGAKGINDAAELRQLTADNRIIHSQPLQAHLEKRINHEEDQVAEDAGKLLVGSLVYLLLPRRRKVRAPLKTRSNRVISG